MAKTYEIRDPIYGFISLDDWERGIVDTPAFQRLRRIRQLAGTNMVYPAANHTRFEHSLGVMHVATQMYNAIVDRAREYLHRELGYDDAGMARWRKLVRIAGLLHDVGQGPFSHATEDLFPENPRTRKPYRHEDYSAAIIRHLLRVAVEDHPVNQQNYRITAEEVAGFLEGDPALGTNLLWRGLIVGQLDADRADYLLRDSHHIGVRYGVYDLNRLLVTLTVVPDPVSGTPVIAVEDGGMHVAEALIIARYQMFTQVYFQHTRRAYDYHITEILKELLPGGKFPPPTDEASLLEFLAWDDWKVVGLINEGKAGEHGEVFMARYHDTCVHATSEIPTESELSDLEKVCAQLSDLITFIDEAERAWYKSGKEDILIVLRPGQPDQEVVPLSILSNVVQNLKPVRQRRVYVRRCNKNRALAVVRDALGKQR